MVWNCVYKEVEEVVDYWVYPSGKVLPETCIKQIIAPTKEDALIEFDSWKSSCGYPVVLISVKEDK